MSKTWDKTVLTTGGAGFIGSNFILYFLNKYPRYQLLNLDKLTYAGDLNNLREVSKGPQYHFIKGDICDGNLLEEIFNKYSIDSIIHFAAESHVDNSINAPDHFIKTNIVGTFTLLETVRKYWLSKAKPLVEHLFHHISTDEVYGSLGAKGSFNEETPYAPNSPYSASKAASDFLVRSYHHTYGLKTVTSNCSNNFGPRQHDEKLIPTIIRNALMGEPIPIYGDGSNVRDWLFVKDHCRALDTVFHDGKSGETYLIGGNNEYNNLYIAQKICRILDNLRPKEKGNYGDQISFVEDRPGHDFRYAIDATKIKRDLGWQPTTSFEKGLIDTVNWYLIKYNT